MQNLMKEVNILRGLLHVGASLTRPKYDELEELAAEYKPSLRRGYR